jgi:hypothetical protein
MAQGVTVKKVEFGEGETVIIGDTKSSLEALKGLAVYVVTESCESGKKPNGAKQAAATGANPAVQAQAAAAAVPGGGKKKKTKAPKKK